MTGLTTDALTIRRQVRTAIVRAGWSATARRAGVDRVALHRAFPVDGDRLPSMRTLALVADALGFTLSIATTEGQEQ